MNRIIIFLFLALMLSGCSGSSKKNQIAGMVCEWQGKTIVLPDGIVDFNSGDTLDISKADYTILTYVDSAGCTGCKMKLPLWREFLNSVDTITDAEIQALMVVNTDDPKELEYLINRDLFEYPVFLDADDKINKRNSFPEDIVYQTFLLDRNRKVVAIGNPTHSPSIAALYKSIISGEQIFNKDISSTIKLNNSRVDVGSIKPGETASKKVRLTNQGNDTVFIREILTSCECTKANIGKRFIVPGGEEDVEITYTGDSVKGTFNRSVNIFYKGFDYPSVVSISGKID